MLLPLRTSQLVADLRIDFNSLAIWTSRQDIRTRQT